MGRAGLWAQIGLYAFVGLLHVVIATLISYVAAVYLVMPLFSFLVFATLLPFKIA